MHPKTEKLNQQWKEIKQEDIPPELINLLNAEFSNEAGPTGEHPEGKISSDDDGALMIKFAGDPVSQTVIMEFGTMTSWVGFPVKDVDRLCETLQKCKIELSKAAN